MNLRMRLADATRPAHEALERQLALDGAMPLDRYKWYLRGMHGFLARVEDPLASDARLAEMRLGLARRRKLPWLESDLRHFALAAIDAPTGPSVPESAWGRAGWAYVLEGSTLGGRFLYRALAPRWSLTPGSGGRFLFGYGEETGTLWRQFVEALDAAEPTAGERRACEAGAVEAFGAIAEWFRACA